MDAFAYTDESGNSGLDLFNERQPIFWTGTLLSPVDLNIAALDLYHNCCTIVNRKELHGNDLGFTRIEKIAGSIQDLIESQNLRFVFSRTDKIYLAGTKLLDLVLDSGSNKAVSTHSYAVRQLRLLNVMHAIQLLEEKDLRRFWKVFQEQDAAGFGALLHELALRVYIAPFDDRTKQILTDAFRWGSDHPLEVLDPFSEMDSPNIVALPDCWIRSTGCILRMA